MENPLLKIRDKKFLFDILALNERVYTYTELGNLVRASTKEAWKRWVEPPDGIVFEQTQEEPEDDQWIILLGVFKTPTTTRFDISFRSSRKINLAISSVHGKACRSSDGGLPAVFEHRVDHARKGAPQAVSWCPYSAQKPVDPFPPLQQGLKRGRCRARDVLSRRLVERRTRSGASLISPTSITSGSSPQSESRTASVVGAHVIGGFHVGRRALCRFSARTPRGLPR